MKKLESFRRKQVTEIQRFFFNFCGMKLIFLGKKFKPVEGPHNLYFSAYSFHHS